MSGRPAEIEDALIEERSLAALEAEIAESNFRAFAREAVIASVALCIIGTLGLLVCMVSDFEVGLATSRHTQIVGMEGQYGAYRPERNVTPLVMGFSAAAYAAALIVTGGALPQLKRLGLPTIYLLAGSGAASLLGLVVLALAV